MYAFRLKYVLMIIFIVVATMFFYEVIRTTDWTKLVVSLKDWAPWVTVIATALSPLIAVQVTRFIDSKKEIYKKKEDIFTTIFALRNGNPNDYNYFTRLNLIPVYFMNEKKVIDSFEEYFDALTSRSIYLSDTVGYSHDKHKVFDERCSTTQIIMIEAMANCLGILIPKHIISTKAWYPSSYASENASRTQAYSAIANIGNDFSKFKEMASKGPVEILKAIIKK
ncbi:hypothetical protein C9426_15005 [Serratia sp. S1B]|nr:hypothetical protein C9426_15005 [Serratia sp. S1B]